MRWMEEKMDNGIKNLQHTLLEMLVALQDFCEKNQIRFFLVGGSLIFLSRFPQIANGISVNVLLPFVLFAGIILAMMLSVKTITWAIKKFNLQDKLDQKAIKRYIHEEL